MYESLLQTFVKPKTFLEDLYSVEIKGWGLMSQFLIHLSIEMISPWVLGTQQIAMAMSVNKA